MRLLGIFVTALLIAFVGAAGFASIPKVPNSCFVGKSYCSSTSVISENGSKYISLVVIAKIPSEKFGGLDGIKDRYYDFSLWPSYAEESDNIDFTISEKRFANSGGKEVIRHFVEYSVKAPWPIRSMGVKDFIEYKDVTNQYPSSSYSAKFSLVKGFTGRKGVKRNSGTVHIVYNRSKDEYTLYYIGEVIPSINIMLSTASSYIEKAILDVLKGMLDLK